ncbi:MAG: hypothetical protein J6J20_06600 [Muribaculaceae bacterium]|nr:hypothetical protein [Muribaculaceae bacterium]
MGTFLFLLLFFFVLLPLGRAAWAFWRQYSAVKRQFRAAEEFRQAYRRAAGYGDTPDPEAPHGRVRKKKIARDVGEYVAFEEVRTYGDDPAPSARPGKPEPQVEDADWEEIK